MAQLALLCAEHAVFEGLKPCVEADFSERLALALELGCVHIWLAQDGESLLAYASATLDFSTLSARPFLHMDCLYLRAGVRGNGLGARLMQAVLDFGAARGCQSMQWQTPVWNEAATRFYLRRGADASDKKRFSLAL